MSEFIHPVEIEKKQDILFETGSSEIVLPERPLVPADEGYHVRVEPKKELPPYFKEEFKIADSLKPFITAVAAARSVFGDPKNPEEYHYFSQWVNVHLLPRFGGQEKLQIEVIGRNARGDTWAKPIDYPKDENYATYETVPEETEMIKRELPKNCQNILAETDKKIFDFDETEYPEHRLGVFQYGPFEVRMAKANPHVEEGGLHLWVHSNRPENAEGVQTDLKNSVEQYILSTAIAKSIFKKTGRAIEIHFSGNWGLPSHYQQDEAVAKGKDPSENYYKENLTCHANLYAAPLGKEVVALPERPVYERPEISDLDRETIKEALAENLPQLLEEFKQKEITEFLGDK